MDNSKNGEIEKIFLDYQKKMKGLENRAHLIFEKYLAKIEKKKIENLRDNLNEKI
jgi:hypothetical protein